MTAEEAYWAGLGPEDVEDCAATPPLRAGGQSNDLSTCPTCEEIRTEHKGFGPSHNGSPRCESGSIASGGQNAHCSCDTCF